MKTWEARSDDVFVVSYTKAVQKLMQSGGLMDFESLPDGKVNMHTIDGTPFPTTLIPPSTVYAMKTWRARSDDVFVVSYAKAGTTWTQEILSAICNDGDIDKVNETETFIRVPHMEASVFKSTEFQGVFIPPMYEVVGMMKSPRLIKTHFSGHLLPPDIMQKKAKIVYVARNPKDVAVSYFYFTNNTPALSSYKSWSEFFDDFYSGNVYCGPWWEHYLYFWNRRHEPNVLFLKFEDMKRDRRGSVERAAAFLGYSFTDDVIDGIVDHCTFENMKKNPMCNPDTFFRRLLSETEEPTKDNVQKPVSFMRKGKVGDWRNHFTVAQNEAMNSLIEEKLAGSGLKFEF